jgi:hypothetical protein
MNTFDFLRPSGERNLDLQHEPPQLSQKRASQSSLANSEVFDLDELSMASSGRASPVLTNDKIVANKPQVVTKGIPFSRSAPMQTLVGSLGNNEERRRFSSSAFGAKLNKIIDELEVDVTDEQTQKEPIPTKSFMKQRTKSEETTHDDGFKHANFFDFIINEDLKIGGGDGSDKTKDSNNDDDLSSKRKNFRMRKKPGAKKRAVSVGSDASYESKDEAVRRQSLSDNVTRLEKETAEMILKLKQMPKLNKTELWLSLTSRGGSGLDMNSALSSPLTGCDFISDSQSPSSPVASTAKSISKTSSSKGEIVSSRFVSNETNFNMPGVENISAAVNKNVHFIPRAVSVDAEPLPLIVPTDETTNVTTKKASLTRKKPVRRAKSEAIAAEVVDDLSSSSQHIVQSKDEIAVPENIRTKEPSASGQKDDLDQLEANVTDKVVKKRKRKFEWLLFLSDWRFSFCVLCFVLLFLAGVVLLFLFAFGKNYYFLFSILQIIFFSRTIFPASC